MSPGFVSGGTADAPIERSDEWLAAQKEIDANKLRKIEQARQSNMGKSLYETLEANKVAKQEAFEEASRFKNQFRALDEDEVEFLDSVLESTRAEEDRVKKETAEGLALFRQQQEEADKRARRGSDGSPIEGEEAWVAGTKKRKRVKEKEGPKGLKIRRSSTANENAKPTKDAPGTFSPEGTSVAKEKSEATKTAAPATKTSSNSKPASPVVVKDQKAPAKGGLGLADYGSDEDDD